MDIIDAFLYASTKEKVYIKQPMGFARCQSSQQTFFCVDSRIENSETDSLDL
jgi:hypothetical protein